MKKLGIVTFHRAMNCGAMLQAYALQEVLGKRYDARILDYRCEKLEYSYKYKMKLIDRLRFCKRYVDWRYLCSREIKRSAQFKRFAKEYFLKSARYTYKNVHKANKKFDFFVAGSDQIWNPKWSDNDRTYYLDFAENEKKYSYAASFGGDEIEEQYKARASASLKTFKSILVREQSGIDILKSLGISTDNAGVVCDPVFLLTKEEWQKRFDLRRDNNSGGYIFLYFAADQTNSAKLAKRIAKETGKKVIYFNSFGTKNIDDSFDNCIAAGPEEFLSMIYNADLVVTTSFHALAFSLIFNTPFIYELNKNKNNNNARLENLASVCGTGGRELKSENDCEFEPVDWDRVNERLNGYRKASEERLFKSLPI